MKKIFLLGAMVCALGMMTACINGTSNPPVIIDALLEDADVVKWYNSDSKVSMTFSSCELYDEALFGSAESFLSNKYVFTYDKQSHIATLQSGEKLFEFTGVVYNKFQSDETAICLLNFNEEKKSGITVKFVIQPAGKHYTMNVISKKYTYQEFYKEGNRSIGWTNSDESVQAASFSQK